jgi:hypothetical protein
VAHGPLCTSTQAGVGLKLRKAQTKDLLKGAKVAVHRHLMQLNPEAQEIFNRLYGQIGGRTTFTGAFNDPATVRQTDERP